jgi:hypothetical protein
MFLHRKKNHSNAVRSCLWKLETKLLALAGEELMRDLNQNASAVTGFRIASTRAAVRQVQKNPNSLLDDVVTFSAADAGDEADAAGVVLVSRMVQALRQWETVFRIETGRHGLRLEDLFPFAAVLLGRAWPGDQISHISVGKAKIRNTLIPSQCGQVQCRISMEPMQISGRFAAATLTWN